MSRLCLKEFPVSAEGLEHGSALFPFSSFLYAHFVHSLLSLEKGDGSIAAHAEYRGALRALSLVNPDIEPILVSVGAFEGKAGACEFEPEGGGAPVEADRTILGE